MSKFWSGILVGIACSVMFYATALAQSDPRMILLEDGTGKAAPIGFAAEANERTLLPVPLLQSKVYGNMSIEPDQKQVRIHFALPRIAFGDRGLDRMMFSSANFSLPYQNIGGINYVDAQIAEKLLGFTMKQTDNALILTPSQYSSFTPRLLQKTGARPTLADDAINLVWQPTFEAKSNLASNAKHTGLNVVSPSWFEIADAAGRVNNNASAEYVQKAHEKGYHVWALITNRFDAAMTHEVLHNEKAKANVIKQLAVYTRLYELDGINLDFENIYDTDKDALTQFVREISEALHTLDAKVSLDVTVPSKTSQWSTCYDRTALGQTVDYIMIMAYDEHWRSSPVSGSVASIGWVEQGIRNTLKEVPAEKIVLGVPFYMREWKERRSDGQKVGTKTMSMEQAEQTIKERNLQPIWLADQGQYYFEYEQDNHRYRVWQEDARSIALKAALVGKYHLAGIAAWRKGFETPAIWTVIDQELAKIAPLK